jgi:AcrR family transcriptional regulator
MFRLPYAAVWMIPPAAAAVKTSMASWQALIAELGCVCRDSPAKPPYDMSPSPPVKRQTKTKINGALSGDDWLDAAFRVFAKNGFEAVRVEPIAKSLGVTKGSFYWHFKDRTALLDALLLSWRERATLRLIDRVERGSASSSDRLTQLFGLTRVNTPLARDHANVEAAIRIWARSDASVRKAVREIDRLRLAYIKTLVQAKSQDPLQSDARAMLIYAFMLAEASVGLAINAETFARCERILLEWSVPEEPRPGSAIAEPKGAQTVAKR